MISSTDPGKNQLLIPSHYSQIPRWLHWLDAAQPAKLRQVRSHVITATTDYWSTKSSLWPALKQITSKLFWSQQKNSKITPKNTHTLNTQHRLSIQTQQQSKHNNRSFIYQTLFYTHHLHQKTSRWKREGTSIKAAGRVTIAPKIDNTVTATTTPPSWQRVARGRMWWVDPLVLGR